MTQPLEPIGQLVSTDDANSPADLVRRIQTGDAGAEAALVRRYARGIAIIVARASSDRGAVDDLCQETFRVALERVRRGEVRDPDRLSGFICSLARNLVIEHFRRVKRRERLEAAWPTRSASAAPTPVDELERRELAALVRQVIDELPSERDRQILMRYYIGEEDRDHICAALGMTRIHFNRVLFRARERFRALYQQAIGERRET
jgi:RNA polymerase sigma-70 factor (ECF subfamily)